MTVYPFAIDSDATIPRVDDNLTEIAGDAINSLRDAVFALQRELGLDPSGAETSVTDRLDVSLNKNGTIKASALTSVGLATLPIVDNQVATSAGIKEYKLALDYSTSNLYSLIVANQLLLNSTVASLSESSSDLYTHIGGGAVLATGGAGRHVGSHIDLNAVPSDPRDPAFVWSGLKDKNGALRSATHVGGALDQINTALTTHENLTASAHPATAITVDTTNFTELTANANTVQKALDEIDDNEALVIGPHRADMHANGVPRTARSELTTSTDGYSLPVVPVTPVTTFLAPPGGLAPSDSVIDGDDVIWFFPVDNSNFVFDSQFSQVAVGDIVRVNYGNGTEASFFVESVRFKPGVEWVIRINGINLLNTTSATARIDRPRFDRNTYGVLAVGHADGSQIDSNIPGGLIVGHPRGATVLGDGFNPDKIDSNHYKLWLELYPNGSPSDLAISLPAIDVTGNAGATPGEYTLESVVKATNKAFRAKGFNYRFIAFEHEGEFGIMLADPINNVSFAIISGSVDGSGGLTVGSATQNVVGDALDGVDVFGFGVNGVNAAGPAYSSSFLNATQARFPTKVHAPLKTRDYVVNGIRRDTFGDTWLANADGSWDGYIETRTPTASTIEVTYQINLDLSQSKLAPGKTIVVQPAIAFTSPSYNNVDYGRFIIKDVTFLPACPPDIPIKTLITVLNGVHATGLPTGFTSPVGTDVKLFFGEDSVIADGNNLIDDSTDVLDDTARFHEILIDSDGRTVVHERAQLGRVAASKPVLGTTNWHITDISPKLRGYVDNNGLLNKYIRFYVMSYDDTTGEFDGYIGRRLGAYPSNANVEKTGPLTPGRKNVPTRFYDETNIDFIELMFDETGSTPSGDLAAALVPAFVDIQVFSSLQTDEELMLLGKYEFDDGSIKFLKDDRQFGNVSEQNFSSSALDFIRSGDRYLHANGVIRGFEFTGADPANSKRLLFNGGVALVNGVISMVNHGDVVIPEIVNTPYDPPKPKDVTWAICVNEHGQFEPIPITATKTQFFTNGGYYVPSVTFVELINARKDLTPVATVTATISSIALGTVNDARRFVAGETQNVPFTWVPAVTEDGLVGHFYSFDAVKTWVNNYGSTNNTIKIRGTHTISSGIDLTTLTSAVTFEGENAVFNVTAERGIRLTSNAKIKNITFNYNPSSSYTSGDVVNIGNGCLWSADAVSNIEISGCSFNTNASDQVSPFIMFAATTELVWDNIKIRGNMFSTAAASTKSQAAIVFASTLSSGTAPVEAKNIFIEENVGGIQHGIYITAPATGGKGLAVSNCRVVNNACGTIGYNVSGYNFAALGSVLDVNFDLNISDNVCQFIACLDPEGDFISGSSVDYGSGLVTITRNRCNWIHVACNNVVTKGSGSLLIDGNTLTGQSQTHIASNHGSAGNIAISVSGLASGNKGVAKVVNNTTDIGVVVGTIYEYSLGAVNISNCDCLIASNVLGGAYGASCDIVALTVPTNGMVANNTLYRTTVVGAQAVRSYVNCASAGAGQIVDNFFDSPYISGTTTTVIINTTNDWVAERNKNQTVTTKIRMVDAGRISFGVAGSGTNGNIAIPASVDSVLLHNRDDVDGLSSPIDGAMRVRVASSQTAPFGYQLLLRDVLPPNVRLRSCAVTYLVSLISDWTTSSVQLVLYQKQTSGVDSTQVGTPDIGTISTTATDTLLINDFTPTNISDLYVLVGSIGSGIQNAIASPKDIVFSAITLEYLW